MSIVNSFNSLSETSSYFIRSPFLSIFPSSLATVHTLNSRTFFSKSRTVTTNPSTLVVQSVVNITLSLTSAPKSKESAINTEAIMPFSSNNKSIVPSSTTPELIMQPKRRVLRLSRKSLALPKTFPAPPRRKIRRKPKFVTIREYSVFDPDASLGQEGS